MFNTQSLFTADALVTQKSNLKASISNGPRFATSQIRLEAANATSHMERDSSTISANVPRAAFPDVGQKGSHQHFNEKISSENVYQTYDIKDRQSTLKTVQMKFKSENSNTADDAQKLRIKGLTE